MPAENDEDLVVYVDGESLTIDKMTFRERREVRRLALELSEDDEDDYTIDDAVMAIVAVAKRRNNPSFDPLSLLDEVPETYLKAPPTQNGGTKAKAAAKKKTS